MSDEISRADYARSLLASAYDPDSMGAQTQLVWCLVNGVAQIGLRSHLQRALHAGADSDLLTNAIKYGRQIFSPGYFTQVNNRKNQCGYDARELGHLTLRTLATGSHSAPTGSMGISMHEVMELFGSLAAKGYFSRSPSRHAVEKYMKEGMPAFERTLHVERVVFDRERLTGDTERVMLGDARKEYVSFHAGKLSIMALVTELADSTLVKETGKRGRDDWFDGMKQDAKLMGEWKNLFFEDLPAPDALVSSSRAVAEEARTFVDPQRHRSGP
ncbi:MAG: hypothetical protein HY516_05010 [Candidatus Aenigmarchaeota archaeon]|nr:hypothetical protein [Candidatus Aenigmarchaeota archaeon]